MGRQRILKKTVKKSTGQTEKPKRSVVFSDGTTLEQRRCEEADRVFDDLHNRFDGNGSVKHFRYDGKGHIVSIETIPVRPSFKPAEFNPSMPVKPRPGER